MVNPVSPAPDPPDVETAAAPPVSQQPDGAAPVPASEAPPAAPAPSEARAAPSGDQPAQPALHSMPAAIVEAINAHAREHRDAPRVDADRLYHPGSGASVTIRDTGRGYWLGEWGRFHEPLFLCPYCGMTALNESDMPEHIASNHPEENWVFQEHLSQARRAGRGNR